MKKNAQTNGDQTTDHIDQIRDIIFGTQKREYDARFDELEQRITSDVEELRRDIKSLGDKLSERLKDAVESIGKNLKNLSSAQETENQHIRELIAIAERTAAGSIENVSKSTIEALDALRLRLNESGNELEQEIREVRQELRNELSDRAAKLHDDKLSKEEWGTLLQEIGMRVRGLNMSDELEKATKSKSKG